MHKGTSGNALNAPARVGLGMIVMGRLGMREEAAREESSGGGAARGLGAHWNVAFVLELYKDDALGVGGHLRGRP